MIFSAGKIPDEVWISKYPSDIVIAAANGNFSPPFEQGSTVLRTVRQKIGVKFENWKLVIPFNQSSDSLFNVNHEETAEPETGKKFENLGIWYGKKVEPEESPDWLLINYPFWQLRDTDNNTAEEILSKLYRSLLSAIEALQTFNFNKISNILMTDLGGSMLKPSIRMKVLSECLGRWLSEKSESTQIVVAFGGAADLELRRQFWEAQSKQSNSDKEQFDEALKIRSVNLDICKKIIKYLRKNLEQSSNTNLVSPFRQAMNAWGDSTLQFPEEMRIARIIVEAVCIEIMNKFNLKQGKDLCSNINIITEFGKISPWITSYFHLLRIHGNHHAHYQEKYKRRPETPGGHDLTAIHAALNSVLNYFYDEICLNKSC